MKPNNTHVGLYVPTQRNGKPNIYRLRRVVGNGPDMLEYQRYQPDRPPYYYGNRDRSIRAYSFSAIKRLVTPILDPDAEEILQAWETRVGRETADRIRQEAIAAGKMAHSMLGRWNEGKPLGTADLNMAGYVRGLREGVLPHLRQASPPIAVVDDRGKLIALSEIFAVDFSQQFLGRLDLVVEIAAEPFSGRRALLELKGARKPKTLEFMQGQIVQGVAYLTAFNAIAARFPERVLPLDGLAMAYVYRSGTGQVIPFFGEDLQEYVEAWQKWLGCFHDLLAGRIAA